MGSPSAFPGNAKGPADMDGGAGRQFRLERSLPMAGSSGAAGSGVPLSVKGAGVGERSRGRWRES